MSEKEGETDQEQEVQSGKGERTYACKHCGESFPAPIRLALHVRTVHPSNARLKDGGEGEQHFDEAPQPALPQQAPKRIWRSKSGESRVPVQEVAEGRFKCKHCGTAFQATMDLAVHTRKAHQAELEAEQSVRFKEEEQRRDEDVWTKIRLMGPEALHGELRARLQELLTAPGIPEMARGYAIQEWDRDPTVRTDFNLLSKTLTMDCGIKPERVMRIVERLWELAEKYRPAVEQSGIPWRNFPPIGVPRPQPPPTYYQPRGFNWSGYPSYGSGYPGGPEQYGRPPYQPYTEQDRYYQPWDPMSGYYQPRPQPFLTKEDFAKMLEEHDRKKEQAQQPEELVELPVPMVGVDGVPLTDPEGKPFVSHVKVPASQAPLYVTFFRPQASKKPEVPLEVSLQLKKLEKDAEEAKVEARGARDALAASEKQAMEARIAELKASMSKLEASIQDARDDARKFASRSSEGWKTDGGKILGDGFHEVADVAREVLEKAPLQQTVKSVMAGGTSPVSVEDENAAPSLMEGELRKRGFIR